MSSGLLFAEGREPWYVYFEITANFVERAGHMQIVFATFI
jgi:hypothetical protein